MDPSYIVMFTYLFVNLLPERELFVERLKVVLEVNFAEGLVLQQVPQFFDGSTQLLNLSISVFHLKGDNSIMSLGTFPLLPTVLSLLQAIWDLIQILIHVCSIRSYYWWIETQIAIKDELNPVQSPVVEYLYNQDTSTVTPPSM